MSHSAPLGLAASARAEHPSITMYNLTTKPREETNFSILNVDSQTNKTIYSVIIKNTNQNFRSINEKIIFTNVENEKKNVWKQNEYQKVIALTREIEFLASFIL